MILQFGLKKPAFRIVVNTPTTLGSIGLTTGLDPSMTLGCGGYGGNITSDNISPRHLLNIKRLAYETSPAPVRRDAQPAARRRCQERPQPPREPGGIAAAPLARRIDEFLASRGYTPPGACTAASPRLASLPASPSSSPKRTGVNPNACTARHQPATVQKPTDFVCEDDVRQAIRQGRKIVIGEHTIITPAARDLGEEHRVFVQASWPR